MPTNRLKIRDLLLRYIKYYTKIRDKDCRQVRNALSCMNVADDAILNCTPAKFKPKLLLYWRDRMIEAKWNRKTVNERVRTIHYICDHAVVHEWMKVETANALRCVRNLTFGDNRVAEPKKISEAKEEDIERLMPFLKPRIQSMVNIQRYTGMRPGELCDMTPGEIDMSMAKEERVWLYKPTDHKNEWRGHKRVIVIGPRAIQEIMKWADWGRPDMPIFRGERAKRKAISVRSYGRCLEMGVEKARAHGIEITPFSPNQLRHTAATRVGHKFGHEAGAALLGDSMPTAQIYIERNIELAKEAARELG